MRHPSFAFRPPKTNSLFIKAIQHTLLPITLPLVPRIAKVEVYGDGLDRLRQFKGKRVILTPNHAEATEPYIVFQLSKMLKQEFNYLTAKEVFEAYFPAGRLLQALGCYSVARGMPDRNAMRVTTNILVAGRRWLVIFPEGVAGGLSEALMPFQPGLGQFAHRAHEELRKKGDKAPIYFVPLAIKTIYGRPMESAIDAALGRLEAALLPHPPSHAITRRDRLLGLGQALLEAHEKEQGLGPNKAAPLAQRVQDMKELIITQTAGAMGVQEKPNQILPDRIRDLINRLDRTIYKPAGGTMYEQKLQGLDREEARMLRARLNTAINFMALDACYLEQALTTERFLDLVGLLETEVFGRRKFWGMRKAVIKVGEPVDFGAFVAKHGADRRNASQDIVRTIESSVRSMLGELSALCTPLEEEP